MPKTPVAVSLEPDSSSAIIALEGDLDVDSAGPVYEKLRELARTDIRHVILDFSKLETLESAGIAAISLASQEFEAAGRRLEARNLATSHRRALEMMPTKLVPAPKEGAEGYFEQVGQRGFDAWAGALQLAELLYDTLRMFWLTLRRKRKLPFEATIEQAVVIGVDALLIVLLLSFLLGLIMAFQSAYQLRQFGANIYVANLVGISMVREFGPMMTAIMLAGRSGSAIAAELGTMKVQEEIDALRTMGIDPIRFLVLPRLLALSVVQPALTLMADFIGMIGGFIIGVLMLDLSTNVYFEQTVEAVTMDDFGHGLLKSLVFAWIIGFSGSHLGLRAGGCRASRGVDGRDGHDVLLMRHGAPPVPARGRRAPPHDPGVCDRGSRPTRRRRCPRAVRRSEPRRDRARVCRCCQPGAAHRPDHRRVLIEIDSRESGQAGLERNTTVAATVALRDAMDPQAVLIRLFLLQQPMVAVATGSLAAAGELPAVVPARTLSAVTPVVPLVSTLTPRSILTALTVVPSVPATAAIT